MKKYTAYKKTDQPYFNFSELLGFPILPMCAIAFISFGILFFFGLTAMLAANVVISVVLTFVFHGLKNASPNGSRNVHAHIPGLIVILSLLPTFVVILGVILIINVGPYIIVTFQETGVFYDVYFYMWLFVLLALPVVYIIMDELKYEFRRHYQAYYFTSLPLNISRDYELLTTEESVTFLQTKKKFLTDVVLVGREKNEYVGKLSSLSVSERNECLYEPLFEQTIHIPKGSDRLRISWYSVIEDTYYEDEIDFPFDKLQYEENKYPSDISKFLRGKRTERVTLSILKGGKIQLFNKHENLLGPVNIRPVQVSEEKKAHQIKSLDYIYPVKNLSALINTIKQSNAIDKRMQLADYECNWQLTGKGLEGHNIEIKDVQNNYVTSAPIALNTFEQRRLPIFFEIDYHKTAWLHIYVDAEKLYSLIQSLADKEPAVTFDFNLDLQHANADLRVKNNGKELSFTAWEKKVIPFRWEEAKDQLLEKSETDIKNGLLKNIYERIVEKNYSAAQQLCRNALEQYPYFPMVYFYEARLLWYIQGFEASYAKQSYFLENTKTDSYATAQIYNHYGCLYDEEKRYPEALLCFEHAYASYPRELFYLSNISEIHYKLKDSKQALHVAEQCIEKGFTSEIIAEIIANKGMQI